MRSLRIQDPVYDAVVFDEPASARASLGVHPDVDARRPKSGRHPGLLSASARHNWAGLLRSREFQRLHFLRQMGLAWLVFPSASQTRFGHSVGVYALGEMALARSRIRTQKSSQAIPMWQWVHKLDLDEEFLAALLLHDLGHFPFSHLLEPLYPEVGHEDLGAGLLLLDQLPASSPLRHHYTAFLNGLGLGDVGEAKTSWQAPLISGVCRSELSQVSRFVVAWLIGAIHSKHHPFLGVGRDWLLEGIERDRKAGLHGGSMEDLEVLKTLVSGLLDLDRFDHYQRDSFFSGIKISNFNFKNFVDGVTIEVPGAPGVMPVVDLSHEAAAQAVSMLEGREILSRYLFQDPQAVAVQQMFQWAARTHLGSFDLDAQQSERFRWLFMTDDEILVELKRSPCRAVREMVDMVVHGRCFALAGEGTVKLTAAIADSVQFADWLTDVATKQKLSGSTDQVPMVLWEPPRAIHERDADPGRQWLDLTRVRVAGEEYSNSDRDTFEYLAKVRRANRRRMRVFVHPSLGGTTDEGFMKALKQLVDFRPVTQ